MQLEIVMETCGTYPQHRQFFLSMFSDHQQIIIVHAERRSQPQKYLVNRSFQGKKQNEQTGLRSFIVYTSVMQNCRHASFAKHFVNVCLKGSALYVTLFCQTFLSKVIHTQTWRYETCIIFNGHWRKWIVCITFMIIVYFWRYYLKEKLTVFPHRRNIHCLQLLLLESLYIMCKIETCIFSPG